MADKRGVFAMLGDLTAAQQTLYSKATGRRGGLSTARRRKRRSGSGTTSRKRGSSARRRRSTGSGRKRGKLVKGSAAAKRYMARIRAKRRK